MAGEKKDSSNPTFDYEDMETEIPSDETLRNSQLLNSLNEEARGEVGKMTNKKRSAQSNQKLYIKSRRKDSPEKNKSKTTSSSSSPIPGSSNSQSNAGSTPTNDVSN